MLFQSKDYDICNKSYLEEKIQKYEKLQNRASVKCVPCNWDTFDYVNFLFLNFKDFEKRMYCSKFYNLLEITKKTNISDYTIYSPGGESPIDISPVAFEGSIKDFEWYATRKNGITNFRAIPYGNFYNWKPLSEIKKLQKKWKDASWEPINVYTLIQLEFEEKEVRAQYQYIKFDETMNSEEFAKIKLSLKEKQILIDAIKNKINKEIAPF